MPERKCHRLKAFPMKVSFEVPFRAVRLNSLGIIGLNVGHTLQCTAYFNETVFTVK